MLAELWQYCGVRCADQAVRRLGYAREAAALEVRHRRCRAAWQPHLDATRAALLAAAQRSQGGRRTAWLVGGGITHDVPLAELLEIFQHVVLIDVAFTRTTRRLALALSGRVSCCYCDVTGSVDWLARRRSFPPDEILATQSRPKHIPEADWIASVNCLMQLPLLPGGWLRRYGIGDRHLEVFGRQLVQNHLDWLRAWRVPFCLITEVADSRYAADGTLVDHIDYRSLLKGLMTSAASMAQWSWLLHPPGELPRGGWEICKVEAWEGCL